jgi:hypothetical protein
LPITIQQKRKVAISFKDSQANLGNSLINIGAIPIGIGLADFTRQVYQPKFLKLVRNGSVSIHNWWLDSNYCWCFID